MSVCKDPSSCPCADKFVDNVHELMGRIGSEMSPFQVKHYLDAAEHVFEPKTFKDVENFVGSHLRHLLVGNELENEKFNALLKDIEGFKTLPSAHQEVGKLFHKSAQNFLDLSTGNFVRKQLGAKIS